MKCFELCNDVFLIPKRAFVVDGSRFCNEEVFCLRKSVRIKLRNVCVSNTLQHTIV